ncbi:unnamed protein product [Adineta steineri]|uniref:Uncharacterized protein n=1 Tax=Adineta steineri TaxID=433720 RepID=A0A814EZV3_9BILA|nr:unnamed protein product [Adineta steineri]CAF0974082.1 unnamed protein product [Adineta steineri]CAF1058064.1 unnamed protein product [Adineta steineri]
MITKFILISVGATVAIAFGLGIIIGHFAIKKTTSSTIAKYDYLTRNADQQNYQTFISSIQSANIEANLKDLTSRPHMAGLPEDLASAIVIEQRWINDGLKVTKPKYNVLLSYPDDNNPNRVTLTSSSGTIIIQTNGTEQVYDITQPKTVNPFLAYTPNGTVSSTKLYYGNYGRLEDLKYLASIVGNASLQGSIIIMRYGKIFRGDKIMNAQYYGAVGAILYSDPIDYAPFGTSADQVYDQKWYMPPSGAQRGSTYTANGDPLTPIYPSTDYMYRVKEESLKYLIKIPAQPIGYGEAQVILQYIQGDNVTKDWSGALPNVVYRYGGILRDSTKIEVRTYNRQERKDTYNVIGIMKGEIEPDRYIVFGNHRDAWSLGALDPTSGTAVLLEMTRAIGEMYKNGFRPRRSLMFCSWGAEEFGLIGSVEYVEEYVKVLGARIISYLNIDIAVEGNYKLRVNTSPLLFDIVIEASKMVPSAYDLAGQTVYDRWMKVDRNNITNEPNINYGLAAGSDYFSFVQLVGSSGMDARYTFDSTIHGNPGSYPLYHTSYEVFSMMKKFIDPDFTAHRTMGQFMGVLILLLSETPILQLNVTRYTFALRQTMNNLKINDPTILNPLRSAIDDFDKTAQDFVRRSKVMDTENPYIIRAYNDQLLQLERAFLNPLGQDSDHTDFKHIVYAPPKTNRYAALGFPTIIDAIASGDKTEINNQIAIATYFVRGALSTLKEFDNFFSTSYY